MFDSGMERKSTAESVLIFAPTGQDAKLISTVLDAKSLGTEIFTDMALMCKRLEEEGGVVLIAEEALSEAALKLLVEQLEEQLVWSDIPLIVMTTSSTNTLNTLRVLEAFGKVGNISLLERPLRTITLETSVFGALRARRKQYQVRDLLIAQVEATRIREEFISVASHELRTPLTSLKLMTQMNQRIINKNPESLTPESMNRLIVVTEKQVSRLTRLVEDMLDVSRIGAGKFIVLKSNVNFAQLIREAVERMGDQLAAVSCEVKLSLPKSFKVPIDQDRMEQVITNLLTNVIRYAPGSEIRIALEVSKGNALFTFADNGPGIQKDRQAKIFDRFERATASNSISGLGLGLYICRQIVSSHGGGIRVESAVGKGTKFLVELPLTS